MKMKIKTFCILKFKWGGWLIVIHFVHTFSNSKTFTIKSIKNLQQFCNDARLTQCIKMFKCLRGRGIVPEFKQICYTDIVINYVAIQQLWQHKKYLLFMFKNPYSVSSWTSESLWSIYCRSKLWRTSNLNLLRKHTKV